MPPAIALRSSHLRLSRKGLSSAWHANEYVVRTKGLVKEFTMGEETLRA